MAIGNDDIQFNRLETIGKAILVYSVISGNLQKLARGYLEDVDSYINIADVRIQQIFDKPFHQSVSPTDAGEVKRCSDHQFNNVLANASFNDLVFNTIFAGYYC